MHRIFCEPRVRRAHDSTEPSERPVAISAVVLTAVSVARGEKCRHDTRDDHVISNCARCSGAETGEKRARDRASDGARARERRRPRLARPGRIAADKRRRWRRGQKQRLQLAGEAAPLLLGLAEARLALLGRHELDLPVAARAGRWRAAVASTVPSAPPCCCCCCCVADGGGRPMPRSRRRMPRQTRAAMSTSSA